MTRLSLNRLEPRQRARPSSRGWAASSLQPQTLATIVAQTDGVPLFVEELTKAVLETGEAAIPASLHGSLMARLDRVPEVKEVAQIAACIGREFDHALLQAVAERPEAVGDGASTSSSPPSWCSGAATGPAPRYTFKHALVQEAACESLLRGKRQAIHARILSVLEGRAPGHTAGDPGAPRRGCRAPARAIVHWHQAGNAALAKSAYVEAAGFLESALGLIPAQPDGADRLAFELDVLLRLGQCRIGIYGLGSEPSRETFHRANELLKVAGPNQPSRLAVQYGLWNWYYVQAELTKALRLGQEALSAEQVDGAPESLLMAQRMVATTYAYLGDLARANALYEQAMPLVDSERSREITARFFADQRIAALYQYSVMRCIQGHADHSRQLMQRAHDLCTPLTPAIQRAYMFLLAAIRAALERDYATLGTELSVVIEIVAKHRMSAWFDGFTDILSVWAAMDGGQPTEHEIARCVGGVNKLETAGQLLFLPFFMSRLATGLSTCACHDEALRMIERASTLCDETSQGWCDAELWRVRGELVLRASQPDSLQAAHCFAKALELARIRGAKLWELRAAVSLARLQAHQRQPADALNVLTPVYEWFSDGVETVDLAETRSLLSELGYRGNRGAFVVS